MFQSWAHFKGTYVCEHITLKNHLGIILPLTGSCRPGCINRMMRQVNLANNCSTFLYACNFGNLKVVQLLLDYSWISEDIDLNVEGYSERINKPGRTGFMLACKIGHVEVVECLLKHSKTFNIDLNTRDYLEWTAVHWACTRGHTKVVELLLNHSSGEEIDFNARNNLGDTAFILACQKGLSNQKY